MKLIVNGDDFGITSACNQTIIDCHQKGRLTSCSLMTNMPAAAEAAALWKENPGLSVGLHICLTAGKPLTEPTSLMKADGTFDKAVWAAGRAVDLQELQTEIQAQFDRFIRLTGKLPEHLDSHHGIEKIPGAAQIMENLSIQHDIPLRAFIYEKPVQTEPEAQLPYLTPPVLLAGSDDDCLLSPEVFVERIREQGQGKEFVELALHPGKADEELEKLSGLRKGREADAANLLSDAFGRLVQQPDVTLTAWRDVPRN